MADAAIVDFSTVFFSALILTHTRGSITSVRAAVTVSYCVEDSCEGSGTAPAEAPKVFADAVDTDAPDSFMRAGYYGTLSGSPSSYVSTNTLLNVGSFTTDGTGAVDTNVCLSRVRPDELSGVICLDYAAQVLPFDHYDRAVIQYPFNTIFPDHGAIDSTASDARASVNADDVTQHYIWYAGDTGYDDAWDWAAITDPDIRQAVYDRYYPYYTYVSR